MNVRRRVVGEEHFLRRKTLQKKAMIATNEVLSQGFLSFHS